MPTKINKNPEKTKHFGIFLMILCYMLLYHDLFTIMDV